MKTVGIIAEYNPFHNGHQYHIEEAKRLSGAEAVVVVMSGNFVQRGTPAIMPKHLRTEAAIKAGASLVIELPVCYATGTAEQFAQGAVSLLHKLGCVDLLCFGSECGDLEEMQKVANILYDEPKAYRELLQSKLRQGLSFPAARSRAMKELYPNESYASILEQPNNILGIEYLKALKRLKSSMIPFTVSRRVSEYHCKELQGNYSSATAIRTALQSEEINALKNQVPASTISILQETYEKRYPIYTNDFSLLLKYRLLKETENQAEESFTKYADVSEELANRIRKQLNQYESYEQFCELLKTKELTYTRISRALLHILLEIKKDDLAEISYARLLGFRKQDAGLLTEIKNSSSIPLISKLVATDELSEPAIQMLNMDIRVSNLYESVVVDKFKTSFINEYEHPIVRI